MVVIFTKAFGKISAGTSIGEGGKNRAALALRPFVYGRYQIKKSGDKYHINGCETINSHFSLGDDVDKFLCASFAMEFTNKLLPEEASTPKLFILFSEFLDMMEKRTKKHETLLVAYQVKALAMSGSCPRLDSCVLCGSKENLVGLSVADGGSVCQECNSKDVSKEALIYTGEFGIISIINFLIEKPLLQLESLALDDKTLEWMKTFLKKYLDYHLGIGCLKSEECMYNL
jgi:DNA repair protein RecO (recombination protein O)